MSTDKDDHSSSTTEPSEVPPTITHPGVPRLAFYLYYSGGLLYMIHCVFHMCMCGHLAHEDGLGRYPLDLAWLALWGGAMLAVAKHHRRNNWRFYFSIFVVGFLSFPPPIARSGFGSCATAFFTHTEQASDREGVGLTPTATQ